MSATPKPGDRVMVVTGLYENHVGTVVPDERGLGLVAVQLDGRHGVLHFWPDELLTIGTQAPTVTDAECDWDDGSFYDVVAAITPRSSSQAGLQAVAFQVTA